MIKKNQSFTFGTLFCGFEFLGAAWESGSHIFSIDKMNQRKKIVQEHYQVTIKWERCLGVYSEVMSGGGGGDPAPRVGTKV
jgi:hypothetical protein